MPEIIETCGDIFASDCEALVNPVDCTGAQGAGLAKLFRQKYPEQCAWYRRHAQKGFAEPGQVYFVLPRRAEPFSANDRFRAARHLLKEHRRCPQAQPLVLFATTKAHYARPSRLDWIRGCCYGLVDAVCELGIRSLAVPPLGCGLGQRGIKPEDAFGWADVRPLILAAAERMNCERVVVYEPWEKR